MQVFRRARRSRRDVLAEDDRATRAGRRELDHAIIVPRCVVDVEPPTEVAVEAFGAIRRPRRGVRRPQASYPVASLRLRLSERRFQDLDILFDGAAAYADARDQFAVEGKRRAAAHRTISSAGHRHQRKQGLSGLHQRKQLGRSNSDQRRRIGFPLRQISRENRRTVHAVLENDVAVDVDNRNGDRYAVRADCALDALSAIFFA